MAIFQKKIGPIFLKEDSNIADDIERLQQFSIKATGALKDEIDHQIKLLKYGQYGEQCIAFELKNSGIDMYILHGIYIEYADLTAQIDYIIVTRKCIYILECKNLIGNIEVDSNGNFIRTYEIGGKKIKEGFYSPITQNQRHLQVLKELGLSRRKNFVSKAIFEKDFAKSYKSLIVLSNPKTFLNVRYAKKDVKDKIVRADQLIEKIRKIDDSFNNSEMSTETMRDVAESLLKHHKNKSSDYVKKYEDRIQEIEVENPELPDKQVCEGLKKTNELQVEQDNYVAQKNDLIRELKALRLEISKKEHIKPYYIFTDAQMHDLITKFPKNTEELMSVNGFGKVKVEKYGKMILEIFMNDR